mgnify:CR=1 FL=1
MTLDHPDDELVLIAAFRYALGRATYMPSVVAGTLLRLWPQLSQNTRSLIHKEIAEALAHDRAGHPCDIATWSTLLPFNLEEDHAEN